MIHMEEMRQLLCRTYPGLRDQVVASADEWIGDDGEFIPHVWLYQLCTLVQQRLLQGDYEQAAALFDLVERLLEEGDNTVKTVIATGFIEDLQHLQQLDAALWQPLLGRSAMAHVKAMNRFHGVGA